MSEDNKKSQPEAGITTEPTVTPPATPATASAPKKAEPLSQMTMWILIGVAFLVGGGGGLAIGMMAGDDDTTSKTTSNSSQFQNSGPGDMGGGPTRGGGTLGEVTKVSSDSITVTDQRSGTETTYKITSDTVITEDSKTASASDIASGDTVMIRSSDSSTATAIDVNPTMGRPQQ
jgi:hypothetical protein